MKNIIAISSPSVEMSQVTVIPSVSRACTWISLIEVKPSLVSVNVDAVSLFFTCLSSCGANIRPVRRWLLSIRAHIPLHARHIFILSMKLPLMTKIEFMRSHDSHLLWAKWNNMPLDMAQSKSCEVWLLQGDTGTYVPFRSSLEGQRRLTPLLPT